MKAGYIAELTARKVEIENVKLTLETLYMDPITDDQIEKSVEDQSKFAEVLTKADTLFTSWGGTLKSVKMAVETRLKLINTNWCEVAKHHP